MRKTVGSFLKVIDNIWDLILVLAIVGLLLLRFAPMLIGYVPVVCLSNSMAPAFHEGSLCYIDTNYDVNSIEVGDVIAFELSNGSRVTHRVHDITDSGIITKGDANDDADISPISREQIIGENVYQIEGIGEFFRSFPNKLLICTVIFALCFKVLLGVLCSALSKDNEEEVNTIEEKVDTCTDSSNDD